MPLYLYSALAENGAPVNGEVAAESEHALREDLAARGLLAQAVRPKRRGILRKNRITVEQFALFNQEFMALMRAGLTVPDAFALASDPSHRAGLWDSRVRSHGRG